MENIRKLAIALLNDEEGISSKAWVILWSMLRKAGDNFDILDSVRSTEGRYYLPYDWKPRRG